MYVYGNRTNKYWICHNQMLHICGTKLLCKFTSNNWTNLLDFSFVPNCCMQCNVYNVIYVYGMVCPKRNEKKGRRMRITPEKKPRSFRWFGLNTFVSNLRLLHRYIIHFFEYNQNGNFEFVAFHEAFVFLRSSFFFLLLLYFHYES